MSQTPPPPPPPQQPINAEQSVEAYMARVEKQRRRNRWIWPVVVVAGLLVVGGMVVGEVDDDNDEPERRMTLVEAACQMLNDGEHPEFVYAVTKDLAADDPLTFGADESVAARVAVERAQAQGCG